MQIINILILLINSYCFFPLIFINTNAKEVIIKNDDNFPYLFDILNDYQIENELILNFVDTYYNMELLNVYTLDVTMISNISLIGNINGTIFDYGKKYKGTFQIIINKENTLKIQNIIFENFYTQDVVHCIKINAKVPNFKIIISNCTLRNNDHSFFAFDLDYPQQVENDFHILFSNCNFYKNIGRIIETHHHEEYKYVDIYNSAVLKLNHCNFTDNHGVLYSHNSKFIVENCM
ncbi:hypothetical protein PIROE2DRAFT_4353 [Piromyces sp. E2]|nr:hypothetical protein PIROE2DRAFT_4353 [Piromyces sp. E2]|eukprot:OUM68069.1 hypothetical protein PIROE2DRAFT_4353 [Piromyces sp. E2]